VEGSRAYYLARNQIEATLSPKLVTIKDFILTKIEMPQIHFYVTCSKGTYIRALVRDFARELNAGAHLLSLTRTAIGNYSLGQAVSIDEFIRQLSEDHDL
jgi:tRNA pseudouridine55 synthase